MYELLMLIINSNFNNKIIPREGGLFQQKAAPKGFGSGHSADPENPYCYDS
jgi:hypothetical protein